jgi:hypothetical protein
MKIGLAIQQVRSAESDLAEELEKVGERHKTDQEVYHLTSTTSLVLRYAGGHGRKTQQDTRRRAQGFE